MWKSFGFLALVALFAFAFISCAPQGGKKPESPSVAPPKAKSVTIQVPHGGGDATVLPPPALLTEDQIRQDFNAYTARISGGVDIERLHETIGKYPFVGVGINYGPDDKGYPEVVGVYFDSPAEKAGFGIGDRIVTINGNPLCDGKDFGTMVGERWKCKSAEVKARLTNAPKTVDIMVERPGDEGHRLEVILWVTKAPIGKDIAAFASEHMAEWEAHIRAQEPTLNALKERFAAWEKSLMRNESELYASQLHIIDNELNALEHELQKPFVEFYQFESSRMISK